MKKLNCAAACLLFIFGMNSAFPQVSGDFTAEDYYTTEDFLRMGYTYDEIESAKEEASLSANVSPADAVITSESHVDWTKKTFVSDINLDIEKAGIPMPSGKSLSLNRIKMELPILVKDPLLSINVDDTNTLGDLVLDGTITLEYLTQTIDESRQTPPYFDTNKNVLKTSNTLMLQQIGSSLVKHHVPFSLEKPIDRISSREYTGIIIDARGLLQVQGEHTRSQVEPCIFPKIWNEEMTLVYERNMVDPKIAVSSGIVDYLKGQGTSKKTERAGKDPLWIDAKKVYGINRCDPVISYDDYLRITSVPKNLELLKQGKVVILLDDNQISHKVSAPKKNIRYFLNYQNVKHTIETSPVIQDTTVDNVPGGFIISMQNLRFIADSSELLPEEKPRVHEIAEQIKRTLENGEYTIRVDGHTADVNKPDGQMYLSRIRAESIVRELIAHGINESIITCNGFGGTQPVETNDTPAGRAMNRRVEIRVMPKGTFTETR